MHVGVAYPWRWEKRSRHSWRKRNLQFYVSGKRPMGPTLRWWRSFGLTRAARSTLPKFKFDVPSSFAWLRTVRCRRCLRRAFIVSWRVFDGGLSLSLMHEEGSLAIEAETKCPPFSTLHIQVHFHEWKCTNFDWNFTVVCSWWFNEQYSSIVSDNGLAPTRRQAIIWSNDDYLTDTHMRYSVSMS